MQFNQRRGQQPFIPQQQRGHNQQRYIPNAPRKAHRVQQLGGVQNLPLQINLQNVNQVNQGRQQPHLNQYGQFGRDINNAHAGNRRHQGTFNINPRPQGEQIPRGN